jgi:hypothetical protein
MGALVAGGMVRAGGRCEGGDFTTGGAGAGEEDVRSGGEKRGVESGRLDGSGPGAGMLGGAVLGLGPACCGGFTPTGGVVRRAEGGVCRDSGVASLGCQGVGVDFGAWTGGGEGGRGGGVDGLGTEGGGDDLGAGADGGGIDLGAEGGDWRGAGAEGMGLGDGD